jgi:hypothetical protein
MDAALKKAGLRLSRPAKVKGRLFGAGVLNQQCSIPGWLRLNRRLDFSLKCLVSGIVSSAATEFRAA